MREFVADVGNTRIKWGLCASEGLFNTAAIPLNDPDAWARQLEEWQCSLSSKWTLAGTHPGARDRFADWLRQRGDTVRILDDFRQIPIHKQVDSPWKVGIDRLLNAVAVLSKGTPAIIIDAGSAVTVDLVDAAHCFRGGAIFPGFRLMAKALNDYTAKLPLVQEFRVEPALPGANTEAAIKAGITNAILGGIDRIVAKLSKIAENPRIYLAGGDASLLTGLDCRPENLGPFLTLEGIRIAARNLS